jgi:Secretion system C-terminal sorting domain
MNWNLVMGSFVANGTEEFLTIGNFKINDSITRIPIDPTTLNPCSCTDLLLDDVSVYPIDLANWLPDTYTYPIGDSALIGLPNYETPDAKWYTYNMQLIDSGSQIKVLPPVSGTQYICAIDLCNTTVYDTVTVVQWSLATSDEQVQINNLQVYPNPATNSVLIKNVIGDKVYMYNAIGELVVAQQVVHSRAEIQIGHLPKGLYFVQDKTRMVKLIKE